MFTTKKDTRVSPVPPIKKLEGTPQHLLCIHMHARALREFIAELEQAAVLTLANEGNPFSPDTPYNFNAVRPLAYNFAKTHDTARQLTIMRDLLGVVERSTVYAEAKTLIDPVLAEHEQWKRDVSAEQARLAREEQVAAEKLALLEREFADSPKIAALREQLEQARAQCAALGQAAAHRL